MIEYVVDGQNRRVVRKLNGVVTTGWLYQNGLNVVAELDGSGAVVSRYVYGSRGHVPDYVEHAGRTYRLVSDHLGSVRQVVDASSGEVAGRCEYGAWGEVAVDSLPTWVSLGYAGGSRTERADWYGSARGTTSQRLGDGRERIRSGKR